jgi:NTP pyrophosphatase (non-canonical NTP hydrolase)
LRDQSSDLLPADYGGLRTLQRQFATYQESAFPTRPSRFFSLELCGEAGELANLEKKVWKGRDIAGERFADEAADVLIAVLNYANSRGIDLAAAAEAKMSAIDRRRVEEGGEALGNAPDEPPREQK